jgi:hypothetical protein
MAVNDYLFPHFTMNCLILNVVHRAVSTPAVLGMKTEQLTLYSTEKQSLLNLDHIRLDYTCKCVKAHSVPLYLGLKNGPFMSLNLIPVQGSPVPLLFQMAPRLDSECPLGPRKRSQICVSE